MEDWVKIYEYNNKAEESSEWLFKILDEKKIPHKEEVKEHWDGYRMPTYYQDIIIYVPKEYKEKVGEIFKEYDNPNNVVYEEAEELKNISHDDDEQLKEIKKGKIAKKMLAWIPIGMILIVIICGIKSSFMY